LLGVLRRGATGWPPQEKGRLQEANEANKRSVVFGYHENEPKVDLLHRRLYLPRPLDHPPENIGCRGRLRRAALPQQVTRVWGLGTSSSVGDSAGYQANGLKVWRASDLTTSSLHVCAVRILTLLCRTSTFCLCFPLVTFRGIRMRGFHLQQLPKLRGVACFRQPQGLTAAGMSL